MFNKKKSNAANGFPGESTSALSTGANDALMRELAVDYMKDKRTRRRWRIAFSIVFMLYLLSALFMMFKDKNTAAFAKPHTAVVELKGAIGAEMGASAEQINKSLRKAFAAPMSKGVILQINSPGGTPVQSAEISDEILRLRAEYPDKAIHVVVSDMCASGGYFVAASANKIFANRSSIVGSIGVRMDSFGFVDAMKKYGIERRSITAGTNKSILDPFLPMKPAQKAHAEKMLAQVHQHFIDVVKNGRGDKLSNDPDLFTGLFWSGEGALDLGLIDGYGSVESVARQEFGTDELMNYTVFPSFLDQFSRQFGVSVGKGIGQIFMNNETIKLH